MSRTRIALQLFCAGLFPPNGTGLEWNEKLNWQPIDFVSPPMNKDPLLFSIGADFRGFVEKLGANFAPMIERNKELFEILEGFTGQALKQPFDVTNLYSALKSQKEIGLELSEWTKQYYPEKLFELCCGAFSVMVSNDELKRAMGGNLLESMIADWEANIAGTSSKKMFIYSGHDTTVIGALGACNVWNPSYFPEYGITAIFELRQNKQTGEYGVQVYVRKEPENEPQLLTIPGCKSFCSLDELKTALSNNLPTASD